MAKFKAVKGKIQEIEEPEDDTSKVILDRFKPVMQPVKAWEPFPEVDHGIVPTPAPWVLVQKRTPRTKVGSIVTSGDTQEVDGFRERIGKMLYVGPGCYKELSGTPAFGVTEGWPAAGDIVVMPSDGGSEFTRVAKDGTKVIVKMFHWRDIMAKVTDIGI